MSDVFAPTDHKSQRRYRSLSRLKSLSAIEGVSCLSRQTS